MVEIEFIYNGNKTIINSESYEKLKKIFQKFKDATNLNKNKLFYSYNGSININGELTFKELANKEDTIRKKMTIQVLEIKNEDIIRTKNIVCPTCKENIKMDIKDYKINLYDCKNGHKIENILLDQFEETQKINPKIPTQLIILYTQKVPLKKLITIALVITII